MPGRRTRFFTYNTYTLEAELETRVSNNTWTKVLGKIESKVSPHSYSTWFKPTSFLDGGCLEHLGPGSELLVRRVAGDELLGADPGRPSLGGAARFVGHSSGRTSRPRPSRLRRHRGRSEKTATATGPTGGSSIPSTPSIPSSSRPATSSPTPHRSRSPSSRRGPTTRSTSTAASDWARPT